MKKMINIRNTIIIVLCITIVLMAIGFIAISVKLKAYRDKEEAVADYPYPFDVVSGAAERIQASVKDAVFAEDPAPPDQKNEINCR